MNLMVKVITLKRKNISQDLSMHTRRAALCDRVMERKLRINPTKNSNYLESQYKYWYTEAFSRNIECKISGPIS